MPSANFSPSAGSTVVDKLKSYEGGTGQTTAAAALAALGGVAATQINQPGGIAGLDSSKKLAASVLPVDSLSVVSVQGPSSVIKGTINTYLITNYDVFGTYTLSASVGTVARNGDTITYTAPSTPQTAGFTLNGRSFVVTVSDYAPVTPVLAGSDMGYGGSGSQLVMTSSAFVMQGNSDTHLNTDWQVATDVNFTNVVLQSLADATNKVSWTAQNLALATTYYVRNRYRSSGGFVSAYSNTATITTKAAYNLTSEEAILTEPLADRVNGDAFGCAVAMDQTGTRVIVGAYQGDISPNTDCGAAYIFVRSGSSWTLEQKLSAADRLNTDQFGWDVGMVADGTRVIVGAPQQSTVAANSGALYIFVRNTTTNVWTQEQKLPAFDTTANRTHGYGVCISADGTRAAGYSANTGRVLTYLRTGSTWAVEGNFFSSVNVAGWAMAMDNDGTRLITGYPQASTNAGVVFIFKRTGTAWAQEATFTATDTAANDCFGASVSIDATGTRVCVTADQGTSATNANGVAYIFLRTGTSWAQEAKLTPTGLAAGSSSRFGTGVSLARDGSRVVIGAALATLTSGTSQAGAQYVFNRVNTTWSQQSIQQASDKATAAWYGGRSAANGWNARGIATDANCNRSIVGSSNRNSPTVGGCAYINT